MSSEEIVGLTWDGLKRFDGNTAVYIRPMYWAEHGGYMGCRPILHRPGSVSASTNRR